MNHYEQRKLITDLVGKAIESGQLKFESPQPIQPVTIQKEESKVPTYQGGSVTFFDLLTCVMFTLNLLGLTDINWFLVFLPFMFPYIVFYGVLWGMMLWAKYKNKKSNEESKTN